MTKKFIFTTVAILNLCLLFFTNQYAAAVDDNSLCNATCINMKHIFEQSSFTVLIYVRNDKGFALGTGTIVVSDKTKYVLTNNHVVKNALRIWMSFYNHGFMYELSVVGRDPASDLALLSVPLLPQEIGVAKFGKTPEIGEEIYALGYPFGIKSVTVGNINALESISWLYLLMQAPINPGNSGGPLFNNTKEIVGINTAMISGANMNFVLPVDYIKMILPRLTREKIVRHGSTDFNFRNASHIPPVFFIENDMPYPPEKDGVMVVNVNPNSSSYASGIRNGDLILKFEGFVVKDARELDKKIFFEYYPDSEVVFTTQRGPQIFDRRVKLVEYLSPLPGKEK